MIVSSVMLILLLSGCWSYHDVEDRTIVAGAAVDVLPSGDVLLTAETVSFGGSETDAESEMITSRGKNIADAIKLMSEKSGKELYWHHATVIIFSEEYARRGVEDLFDYIMNDNEARLTLRLAVARVENARDVFELEAYGSQIKCQALDSMIQESEHLGRTPSRKACDNINAYLEPGMEMLMPQIYEDAEGGKSCAAVEGSALFRGGKLAGWLDRDETEMLLLLKNEVKRMALDVELENGGLVTIPAENWKCSSKVENGIIDIDISAQYKIAESQGKVDLNSAEGFRQVETAAAKQLRSRIEKLINTLKEYDVDSIGWSRKIYNKDPESYNPECYPLDFDRKYSIKLKKENMFDSFSSLGEDHG